MTPDQKDELLLWLYDALDARGLQGSQRVRAMQIVEESVALGLSLAECRDRLEQTFQLADNAFVEDLTQFEKPKGPPPDGGEIGS